MSIFKTLNAEGTLFSSEDGRRSWNDKGPEYRAMLEDVANGGTLNPYVPPALPAVDDIPLSAEDRLQLLGAENPVPPAKVSAYKQGKRDRGEA